MLCAIIFLNKKFKLVKSLKLLLFSNLEERDEDDTFTDDTNHHE